jgi:hypothetical protein
MKADWLVCFRSRVAGLHVLGYKNRFIGRCHVHRSHDPTMLMTSLNRKRHAGSLLDRVITAADS